jgi:cytochrome b561
MDAVTSMNVHAEVLWACGYALFLLAVARGLVAMRQRVRAKDDAWPRTDAARLHHGLCLLLVLLAGLLVGACAVRHPEDLELGLLGLVSLTVAWMARRTWVEWWAEASSRGEG